MFVEKIVNDGWALERLYDLEDNIPDTCEADL